MCYDYALTLKCYWPLLIYILACTLFCMLGDFLAQAQLLNLAITRQLESGMMQESVVPSLH